MFWLVVIEVCYYFVQWLFVEDQQVVLLIGQVVEVIVQWCFDVVFCVVVQVFVFVQFVVFDGFCVWMCQGYCDVVFEYFDLDVVVVVVVDQELSIQCVSVVVGVFYYEGLCFLFCMWGGVEDCVVFEQVYLLFVVVVGDIDGILCVQFDFVVIYQLQDVYFVFVGGVVGQLVYVGVVFVLGVVQGQQYCCCCGLVVLVFVLFFGVVWCVGDWCLNYCLWFGQ